MPRTPSASRDRSASAAGTGESGGSISSAPAPLLSIRYVPLSTATLWEKNPKRHSLPSIIASIREHGFRDAPIFDATLGALVAGNGRTEALITMFADGEPPPLGIALDPISGEWHLPVQFGLDAISISRAEAFGIDHNLLTISGLGLSTESLLGIFDSAPLLDILGDLAPDALFSVTGAEIESYVSHQADAMPLAAPNDNRTANDGQAAGRDFREPSTPDNSQACRSRVRR